MLRQWQLNAKQQEHHKATHQEFTKLRPIACLFPGKQEKAVLSLKGCFPQGRFFPKDKPLLLCSTKVFNSLFPLTKSITWPIYVTAQGPDVVALG